MSRIYVPPSQDTLFMRGFSYHHRIEDIKDFFVREAGRCMVEFNKDDGSDGQYVALKFESRDVAKEVYRRFNDREILGDRISMTWYKDLRRIKRMNASRRYQRGGFYGSDQYEYRGSYQRSGYQRSHYRPTSSSRMRKYSRSSSRSRSASRSPTQSRSRSRSSSRSYDSRDFKKKRSASSGFDQHGKSSIRKRMRYTRNEGYESSESMNQKKMERKKNDGTLVEGIDNKTMENVENNASMIDSNQSMGMNDGVETSPQHKAAAVRSLVQKKVEESKFAPVPSEDRQAVSSENQNHNTTDAQKELNESDRNILELHPSDDEELEIEDNIDEASLVSLNFSNPAPEQPNKELSFTGTVNVEEVQNEKEVQQVNNTSRVSLENGSTLESCRQAADKSMVSFDLHVQQRKDAIAGLSYEKLKLMKEKKEEIEKAYRQDCETLVMVTKLLVSKDPELEDRIQNSLRENLREIGHRCIQELKEFVEKVKTDEEF